MLIINSMTIQQQLQNAAAVMAATPAANGSGLMFPNGLKNAVLVQATIRGEVQLNATSTQFTIPLLQNAANNSTTPQTASAYALSMQDGFLITDIAILVSKRASALDATAASYAYAPASVFTTANAASSIIGMYDNGFLKLTVNQQVITPYWDLRKHYKAPDQQFAANADYTTSGINYVPSEDGTSDGFYPVVPGWYIDGAGNVQLTLNLGANLAAVETYEFVNVLCRGFILQNSSSFKR